MTAVIAVGAVAGTPPIKVAIGGPDGIFRIVDTARGERPAVDVVGEFWFHHAGLASRVHAVAAERWPPPGSGCWADLSAEMFAVSVKGAAEELKIEVKDSASVLEQAMAAADMVAAKSEEMRLSGELAAMNAAYKAYRVSFKPSEAMPKPEDYQDWMHRVRLAAARTAGEQIRKTLRFSTC